MGEKAVVFTPEGWQLWTKPPGCSAWALPLGPHKQLEALLLAAILSGYLNPPIAFKLMEGEPK